MNRTVSRRLNRLEERAAVASRKWSHSVRFLLVNPQKGCTGVLVIETGKPHRKELPTPAEIESVRADIERHRAGRKTATDIR
jgi:hypothetical protein